MTTFAALTREKTARVTRDMLKPYHEALQGIVSGVFPWANTRTVIDPKSGDTELHADVGEERYLKLVLKLYSDPMDMIPVPCLLLVYYKAQFLGGNSRAYPEAYKGLERDSISLHDPMWEQTVIGWLSAARFEWDRTTLRLDSVGSQYTLLGHDLEKLSAAHHPTVMRLLLPNQRGFILYHKENEAEPYEPEEPPLMWVWTLNGNPLSWPPSTTFDAALEKLGTSASS